MVMHPRLHVIETTDDVVWRETCFLLAELPDRFLRDDFDVALEKIFPPAWGIRIVFVYDFSASGREVLIQ